MKKLFLTDEEKNFKLEPFCLICKAIDPEDCKCEDGEDDIFTNQYIDEFYFQYLL